MNNNPKKISVILRVRSKEFYVGFCIQSLIDSLSNFEIIVINNKTDEGTLKTIKHFQKSDEVIPDKKNNHVNIKFIDIENYTPGKALNLGNKYATGEYTLIISSHCKIINFNQPETLKLLNKYSAIFFKQIPVWNGRRIIPKYIWSNFGNEKKVNLFSDNENRYFFHNAFSMFKRETLDKFPFNVDLISKEDRYWANKIIKSEKNILYYPDNIAEHYYTQNGSTWRNL